MTGTKKYGTGRGAGDEERDALARVPSGHGAPPHSRAASPVAHIIAWEGAFRVGLWSFTVVPYWACDLVSHQDNIGGPGERRLPSAGRYGHRSRRCRRAKFAGGLFAHDRLRLILPVQRRSRQSVSATRVRFFAPLLYFVPAVEPRRPSLGEGGGCPRTATPSEPPDGGSLGTSWACVLSALRRKNERGMGRLPQTRSFFRLTGRGSHNVMAVFGRPTPHSLPRPHSRPGQGRGHDSSAQRMPHDSTQQQAGRQASSRARAAPSYMIPYPPRHTG